MKLDKVKHLAKSKLTPKRYTHVKNVANAAEELAILYGADVEKARLAAYLHDIVKEEKREDLLRILQQDVIIAQSTAKRPRPVWHGPAAAVYAKHTLGITDEEVLSAVACHTMGKVNMSLLDKILFVADLISEERDFPGVEAIRQAAEENLDKATLLAMQRRIDFVLESGRELDPDSAVVLKDMQRHQAGA